jgi:predicted Rossmann-fold nucleotide-binding protein
MDELFETLTLIQTKNWKKKIFGVLFDRNFWQKMINFDMMANMGSFPEDTECFIISTHRKRL